MIKAEILNKVNQEIINWSKNHSKIVIAIDGYTGVGKTTLLSQLAQINPQIIAVNRDDFMIPSIQIKEKLLNSHNKSKVFEKEILDYKKLEDLVYTFRHNDCLYKIDAYDNEGRSGKVNIPKVFDFSRKILVIEGVFMFHPELSFHKLWDKRIYLTGEKDKIDQRRIEREKTRYGKDYFPEDHPDSYFRHVITALERYTSLYNPENIADLVVKID